MPKGYAGPKSAGSEKGSFGGGMKKPVAKGQAKPAPFKTAKITTGKKK